ncbi:Vesicle transport protein SEC20 [Holothuria leucospilota]|uniref:Vesicle transport protein SEC20 n=1 Tax=Holothuria leucospilota TaxID=206669 RepID=A0A9Q0YT72_HOLLE|nr:Vesicle transport protein SEC20 [Holothuria leucospilota]
MALNELRIKSCVQEIVKTDLEIHAMMEDLKNCESLPHLDEANATVRVHMQKLKKKVEDLERIAKEQDKEDDKRGLLEEVQKYRKQYSSTQTAVKKANLSCLFEMERKERDELMSNQVDPELRKRKNRENLAKTASSITESLYSLNKLMADNVTNSEVTNQVLYSSSDNLGSVHEEFKGMASVTQTSRKLLTKYNRRELTDRLLIFLAVAFFLGTVVYILKKRLF